MPKRVQRKRVKGWKMPANCISVTRPGRWGNPFILGCHDDNPKRLVLFFRECLDRAIRKMPFPASPDGTALDEDTIARFEWMAENLHAIRGKDLACFCKEGDPCHGEALIEAANR